MKLQRALREQIRKFDADAIHSEPWCSCGSPNHARIFLFRVNGRPTTALVPEWCELTAERFAQILPGAKIELINEAEFDAAGDEGELGHMQPFENPFGTGVYLDEKLLSHATIVFCPRMFSGLRGQCYRVPTQDLVSTVLPMILAISGEPAKVDGVEAV
jgi:hypothetical protein